MRMMVVMMMVMVMVMVVMVMVVMVMEEYLGLQKIVRMALGARSSYCKALGNGQIGLIETSCSGDLLYYICCYLVCD